MDLSQISIEVHTPCPLISPLSTHRHTRAVQCFGQLWTEGHSQELSPTPPSHRSLDAPPPPLGLRYLLKILTRDPTPWVGKSGMHAYSSMLQLLRRLHQRQESRHFSGLLRVVGSGKPVGPVIPHACHVRQSQSDVMLQAMKGQRLQSVAKRS